MSKDYKGFIKKDTEWLDQKPVDESKKIIMPAYSHVYAQKVPA